MSRILPTIVLAAVSLFSQAEPQIAWLNPSHNFGAFREETGPVTCIFKGVNIGDEDVTVISAVANCGCTRPEYPRRPIAPGDTLSISVTYDPSGRPGRFRKQVKVRSNAGESVLNINGTVIGASNTLRSRYPESAGDIRFSNRITPFGETLKGHVLSAAINIYNPTSDTIVPATADLPPYINALIRPVAIPPGEQGTVSLTAYTDRAEGWGLIEDSFILIPDNRHPETDATIRTVMILNEDFSKLTPEQLAKAPKASLSDKTVDFGTIDTADGQQNRTLTVTNEGREPLLIRNLTTPDKALTVGISARKIKPGKSATLTITVDPRLAEQLATGENAVNARITLVTNAPSSPSQIIRVVGLIAK